MGVADAEAEGNSARDGKGIGSGGGEVCRLPGVGRQKGYSQVRWLGVGDMAVGRAFLVEQQNGLKGEDHLPSAIRGFSKLLSLASIQIVS